MTLQSADQPVAKVKLPHNLSPRIQWLRDYYFRGCGE